MRLLPAFEKSRVSVIGNAGCPDQTPFTNCSGTRGNLYISTASDSWVKHIFDDGLKSSEAGEFLRGLGNGTDTVTIGGQMALMQQEIDIITSYTSFLGVFGLSNQTRYGFLSGASQIAGIPSNVWSYTAGSANRKDRCAATREEKLISIVKTPASLIIGGYDASRYLGTHTMFMTMDPAVGSGFVVNLTGLSIIEKTAPVGNQSIAGVAKIPSPAPAIPLQDAITVIETETPFFWLPDAACNRIEESLGISQEPVSQLYIITEAQHRSLSQRNFSIEFSFAYHTSDPPSSGTQEFTIPYSSLHLNASYPLFNASAPVRYFPLRRGPYPGTDRFVLGRAFLQDTYLTANFDQSSFTLSQAQYTSGPPQIMRVTPTAPRNSSPPYYSSATIYDSSGVWIVIITLASFLGVLCTVLGYCCFAYKKRKWPLKHTRGKREQRKKELADQSLDDESVLRSKAELDGGGSMKSDSTKALVEIHSKEIFEANDTTTPVELFGWEKVEAHGDSKVVFELDVRSAKNVRDSVIGQAHSPGEFQVARKPVAILPRRGALI